MNDICKISIEIMIFNNDTKTELDKMAKHIGIKIIYYSGYIVMFNNAKIHYSQ